MYEPDCTLNENVGQLGKFLKTAFLKKYLSRLDWRNVILGRSVSRAITDQSARGTFDKINTN